MTSDCLRNCEAVTDSSPFLVSGLQPSLLPRLEFHDVEVAVADGGLDQVVTAALRPVSCRKIIGRRF